MTKRNYIGLSPRGRGNLQVWDAKSPDAGSIPAWAGQPDAGGRVKAELAVYPRVGGATVTIYIILRL